MDERQLCKILEHSVRADGKSKVGLQEASVPEWNLNHNYSLSIHFLNCARLLNCARPDEVEPQLVYNFKKLRAMSLLPKTVRDARAKTSAHEQESPAPIQSDCVAAT